MMESLVRKYFQALQEKDFETLSTCYSDNFIFSDPVAGKLTGKEAKIIWRMYADTVDDLKIDFRIVQLDDIEETAWVHWDAYYNTQDGKKQVFNKIDTHFEISKGKLSSQEDDFILKDWARQIMGMKARLFGGTKLFQNNMIRRTREMLSRYIKDKQL